MPREVTYFSFWLLNRTLYRKVCLTPGILKSPLHLSLWVLTITSGTTFKWPNLEPVQVAFFLVVAGIKYTWISRNIHLCQSDDWKQATPWGTPRPTPSWPIPWLIKTNVVFSLWVAYHDWSIQNCNSVAILHSCDVLFTERLFSSFN